MGAPPPTGVFPPSSGVSPPLGGGGVWAERVERLIVIPIIIGSVMPMQSIVHARPKAGIVINAVLSLIIFS